MTAADNGAPVVTHEVWPLMSTRRLFRRILIAGLVGIIFAAGYFALHFYAWSQVPTSNRAYAETWRGAPISALLDMKMPAARMIETPLAGSGTIVHYHFNGWRGMKGRTYPGSRLAFLLRESDLYMESGVRLYTAPASTWCEITFSADAQGIITDIDYRGNDCG